MIDELVFALKLMTIKDLIQPGKTLDVGCGDKRYTVHLPDAVGIDKYRECDNIKANPDVWMDACDLKYPEAIFDNATFFDVLEHIPETGIAVNEAWRVLKPNGILAVIDPNDKALFWARLLTGRRDDAFRGRRTKHRDTEDSPGHLHDFGKTQLVELMGSKFTLEKCMNRIIFTGYRFRRNP